jgi:dTDP-4-dehydrorhamnose reductase
MNILIIGKGGQLGESLREVIERGNGETHTLLMPDRQEFDLTNAEQMQTYLAAHKPDLCINAAAYNLLPQAEENPEPAFAVNTFAVWRLAKLCKENDVKFVTYSTDYVFDGAKGEPYTETDTPNPLTDTPNPLQMYGISKYAGELATRNINEDAFVIRTCGLYGGPTGSPDKGNFVLYVLEQAKTASELEVGSHTTVTPTWSDDLARATLSLLSKNAGAGIYHLVNEGTCSMAEFAQEIVSYRQLTLNIIPKDMSGAPGMKRPNFSALANTNGAAVGVTLPHWKEALHAYLDSLKS